MALFRRQSSSPATHPLTDFWSWWAESGHTLSPHQPSAATDELNRRLQAINPGLTWHFGPGDSAQHRLTVSAGGVAEIRPQAERWLRAAPAPTETWEFRSSQQPDPDALSNVLELGGDRFDLAEIAFRIESVEQERRVHVGVWHPGFPKAARGVATQVTYLVLDWVLGEDTVERWLGHIEVLTDDRAEGTAESLKREVASLAASVEPDSWALAQWESKDGVPGIALFRTDLRWVDAPTLDLHHEVTIDYQAQDNGLPTSEALDLLARVEETLIESVGERGKLVSHESSNGHRTYHVYTDSEDQNVADALDNAVSLTGAAAASSPDPAWHAVRRFTG